jgi:RNA polymerase sigma-70 factor (ECF subfamily)
MTAEAARRRFRDIVPPHLDDAYALAKWLSGSGADAEDIVQEAALRALAALEGTVPLKPRAWWLSVVRNTALTWMRRNRSKTLAFVGDLDDVDALEPGGDPAPDPETALIALDEGERVRRAIAGLPSPLRETLVLREIEDLDYREIAEATQAPIGTVMSRLSRARAALARKLGART